MQVLINGAPKWTLINGAPSQPTAAYGNGHKASGAAAMPDFNLDGLTEQVLDFAQDILICGSVIMVVVAGAMFLIGMRKEGFQRCGSLVQGLACGIIGPSVIVVIAKAFVSVAAMFH